MAEQETSYASNQARTNAQNRSQNEGQGSVSRSRGGSRGGRRRGRGGRNRGQRQDGPTQGSEGRGNAPQTVSTDATIETPTIAPTAGTTASAAPESSGASRGRRNRRGNRGGPQGQGNHGRGVFSMGPQRAFGGRLTTTEQLTETAQDASLSADAPEFVPGQPLSQMSTHQQSPTTTQSPAQGRSRDRPRNRKQDRPHQEVPKSTASELWQRIQEDIANWNYECRICTEEVTRKTEVWSCTTCWTVVHLECAHQWWDTSMKVNEESGDRSWRCPGCNSTLTDEPGDTVESGVETFFPVDSMNVLKYATQASAVPARTTFVIRLMPPIILGLRALSAVRVLAEEPSTAVYIVARSLAIRKKRPQLIVPSLRMSSPIVLATAAVVESQVKRSATRGIFSNPYASRCARPLVTVEDIGVESIVAQVKRRLLSVLLSRRSNAWVLIHYQSRPSISVSPSVEGHLSVVATFASSSATVELVKAALRRSGKKFRAIAARQFYIHRNLAERDNRLARTSASGRLLADILLLTISAILMMYHARHVLISFRNSASVARQLFTINLATYKRLTAESSAGRNYLADFIHAKSCVIALESVEMLRTVASKSAESPSYYVTTHARASVMGKLLVKSQQPVNNPTPSRPEIRCDEECERLDRNRRLAAALNIDPASHTNDHIPFSDNTLKLYKQMQSWGDAQESQFRVFSANKDEVRLRYEPMKNQSRQFLHLLAEDFGFESKSEDYDIHRSVLVWKSAKFVSAPTKTLAQCVKIRAAQAAEAAAAAALRPSSPPVLETEPFNALVLTEPRFGLTIEEVNAALEADLTSLQGFSFKVDFLNEEVLIKATVSYSAFLTPAPMEKSLEILKSRIEQTIRRQKLAENVLLCHSDATGAISRREVPLRAGTGGWSAVAGRAASKPMSSSSSTPSPEEAKPGRRLLLGLKKKRPQQPEVGKVWAALDGDVEC
ncbi:cysteine-rich NFX-1 [Fusarium beomiforme]|uniref:Cysteine-rich NFX-1 n=1 Tax=Fusarium beomiforme TaxID=44412 RepID=A0A9P5AU02_9HYPO|nr:cysteine-rich NFX-1 [Fusarium beomiforme]